MNVVTKFTIPAVPPSYNQNFQINYHMRQVYLSKEAREFKKLVYLYTPAIPAGIKYTLLISIYDDWYFKNGNMRKKDVQNLDKLLIDEVFRKIGQDDFMVWTSCISKVQSKKEQKTEVTVITHEE